MKRTEDVHLIKVLYSEGYFEKPIILIMLKFYNFTFKQFPGLKILDEKFT